MGTKIGVIESKWASPGNGIAKNTSVRPLFEFFSDIHYGSHHHFEYDLVGTRDAFRSALKRFSKSRTVTVAYIGMHGSHTHLHLHGGENISRTVLRNDLVGIVSEAGANLSGLYFGSCLFAGAALAEHLLAPATRIEWVAGYSESVDFVESTALDLLFFNTWQYVKEDDGFNTRGSRIREVARRMKILAPGLCSTSLENGEGELGLGFSIYVRKTGRGGGIRDLMRS
jgi:hypothetical protein